MSIGSLFQSSIVRNFAKLLSANVVAQVIGLLVYPILTRIYAPEDFGLLNLFLSIGGILTLISLAEYHYAIVLPKEKKDAVTVVQAGACLLIGCTLLVGISTLFANSIAALFNSPRLAVYYWAMPIYVFILGIWNLLNYWYIREKCYNKISTYQLSQSMASAGSKLAFGFGGVLAGGMIYATLIGPIVSIIIVCLKGFKQHIQPLFRIHSIHDIHQIAKQYKNFPLFATPRSLLNTIGGNLPVLVLTPHFGLAEIGFLGMAFTIAFRPINLVCNSIYQVLFQATSERVAQGKKVLAFIRQYLLKIGGISILIFSILYCILPWIITGLLGKEWSNTSQYIRVMLPWLLFVILNTSLSFLPDVFNRQATYLGFEVLYLGLRLGALIIGISLQSIYHAIAFYSLAGAIVLGIELCWFIYMMYEHDKNTKEDNI